MKGTTPPRVIVTDLDSQTGLARTVGEALRSWWFAVGEEPLSASAGASGVVDGWAHGREGVFADLGFREAAPAAQELRAYPHEPYSRNRKSSRWRYARKSSRANLRKEATRTLPRGDRSHR